MMKAKVDAAPMTPSRSRARNSSSRVRATAMRRKPAPCSSSTQMYRVFGLATRASRPQTGPVTTVVRGLIPRIHPDQRRVAAASRVEIRVM
jgi:hypothetical protein